MAEFAFQTLKDLASGESRVEDVESSASGDALEDIPYCLKKELRNGVRYGFFPCLVCAKLFHSVRNLIDHGQVHQMDNEWPDGVVYCCYCGIMFKSKAGLLIHQTPRIEVRMNCPSDSCDAYFDRDRHQTHICTSKRSPDKSKDCPLNCDFRKTEDSQDLSLHLKLAHGCKDKVQVSILKHSNKITNCPMCSERFNKGSKAAIGLHVHLSLYCPRVGDIQKSFLKSIYEGAKEDGCDPDIILMQELESVLFDVLACIEKVGKSESNEASSYLTHILNKVYSGDFKQFLIDAVSWEADKIYNEYEKLKEDFLLLFQIWCASVEYNLSDQDPRHVASLYEQTISNNALSTLTGGPFSTIISKESVVYLTND